MLKKLKLVPIVLIITFVSFPLASPLDKEKIFEEKTSVEKIPEGKVVVIPKSETDPLQNYHLPWSCLNGGGLDMASTSYKAMVSSAQTFIGESQSTNYQLQIGYWYGGKPFMCADASGDVNISVSDVIHLVNYLFKFGPEPIC